MRHLIKPSFVRSQLNRLLILAALCLPLVADAQDSPSFTISFNAARHFPVLTGLRNFEGELMKYNLEAQNRGGLVKPFEYTNDFMGFGIGLTGPINDDDEFFEVSWNHHRNIFSGIFGGETVDFRKRINYISFGGASMFNKIFYAGVTNDIGKLSVHQRTYLVGDNPPKFEKYYSGKFFKSPGGRFFAFSIFVGLLPRMSERIAVSARAYVQLHPFPSGAYDPEGNHFLLNSTNYGMKISLLVR